MDGSVLYGVKLISSGMAAGVDELVITREMKYLAMEEIEMVDIFGDSLNRDMSKRREVALDIAGSLTESAVPKTAGDWLEYYGATF
jgi:hypothetical protein